MTVCWVLNLVCTELSGRLEAANIQLLTGLSMIFGISYGIATAIIFITTSGEARQRWHNLFRTFITANHSDNLRLPIDLDFSEDDQFSVQTDPFRNDMTSSGGLSGLSSSANRSRGSMQSTNSKGSSTAKGSQYRANSVVSTDSSVKSSLSDALMPYAEGYGHRKPGFDFEDL